MSYRSPEQSLEDPIRTLQKGINSFCMVVTKRIYSQEWNKDHILKLRDLRHKLLDLQVELIDLDKETW